MVEDSTVSPHDEPVQGFRTRKRANLDFKRTEVRKLPCLKIEIGTVERICHTGSEACEVCKDLLSDRPMGGLTAGGALKGARGRRPLSRFARCTTHADEKYTADGQEEPVAFPT